MPPPAPIAEGFETRLRMIGLECHLAKSFRKTNTNEAGV